MKRIKPTFIRAVKKSMKTLVWVLRIIVPVALIVTLIRATPLIGVISSVMQPVMGIFGLSGEASLPLILGMFSGTGEAAGAIAALGLPAREITIIAVMVGICNSLIGETLIYKKISKEYWKTAVIRFFAAILTGLMLRMVI